MVEEMVLGQVPDSFPIITARSSYGSVISRSMWLLLGLLTFIVTSIWL
jgi:hypothetical protein